MTRDPRADELLREALTYAGMVARSNGPSKQETIYAGQFANRIRDYLAEPQGERVVIAVRREDAYSVALGPLDYTIKARAGEVPDGGSPMRVRREMLKALGRAQIGPWRVVGVTRDPRADELLGQASDIFNGASIYLGHKERLRDEIDAYLGEPHDEAVGDDLLREALELTRGRRWSTALRDWANRTHAHLGMLLGEELDAPAVIKGVVQPIRDRDPLRIPPEED